MSGFAAGAAATGQALAGAGKFAGGLANVYGAYKGAEMARDQFSDDRERYEAQLERMRMLDALTKNQLNLSNLAQFQQNATGQENRLQNIYGNYNRSIGR